MRLRRLMEPSMSSPAKQRPATSPVVVTANRLQDGRVVWLTHDGGWSERLGDARVFVPDDGEAGLALGRAGEDARLVVGAYLVEVILNGPDASEPVRLRERLRLRGPSVMPLAS